jgi:hypothetical protein
VWNVKEQTLAVVQIDVASYYGSAVVQAESDCLVTIFPNGIGHAWNLADGTRRVDFVINAPFTTVVPEHMPYAGVRACVAIGDFIAVHVGSHVVRIYA